MKSMLPKMESNNTRKIFLQIHATMWRESAFLRLNFFFLQFVPILFENDHRSSWWLTHLMFVFCNRAKSHMTTNENRGRASDAPPAKSTPWRFDNP